MTLDSLRLVESHSNKSLSIWNDQDWDQLSYDITQHGLAGLIYKECKNILPEQLLEEFKKHWQTQLALNLIYLSELEWLENVSQEKALQFTVLKGAALLEDIYEDIGSRSMGDVDILIHSKDRPQWIEIFSVRGYLEVPNQRWEANSFKLSFSRWENGIEIVFELHERLFYEEECWVKWQSSSSKSGHLPCLSKENMLVHLMGHLGYQHTFLKLSWLIDIDRFIRKYSTSLNWESIFNASRILHQQRSTSAVLWACHNFLKTPLPFPIESCTDKTSRLLWRVLLTRSFLWAPQKRPFRYYLLKHCLKDNLARAFAYDYLWLKRRAWK